MTLRLITPTLVLFTEVVLALCREILFQNAYMSSTQGEKLASLAYDRDSNTFAQTSYLGSSSWWVGELDQKYNITKFNIHAISGGFLHLMVANEFNPDKPNLEGFISIWDTVKPVDNMKRAILYMTTSQYVALLAEAGDKLVVFEVYVYGQPVNTSTEIQFSNNRTSPTEASKGQSSLHNMWMLILFVPIVLVACVTAILIRRFRKPKTVDSSLSSSSMSS